MPQKDFERKQSCRCHVPPCVIAILRTPTAAIRRRKAFLMQLGARLPRRVIASTGPPLSAIRKKNTTRTTCCAHVPQRVVARPDAGGPWQSPRLKRRIAVSGASTPYAPIVYAGMRPKNLSERHGLNLLVFRNYPWAAFSQTPRAHYGQEHACAYRTGRAEWHGRFGVGQSVP
jgi:hypothetical protein